MIFHFRLAGMGKNAISRELNELGIPAKNGGIWHESVIDTILRNEKYQGDLVLQKYFRTDHLRKIDCKNKGELPKYVVRDNHEAIIPREEFAAVQRIIQKKAAEFPEGYGVHKVFPNDLLCHLDLLLSQMRNRANPYGYAVFVSSATSADCSVSFGGQPCT